MELIISKGYDFSDVTFKLQDSPRYGIRNNIMVANVIDVNGEPKILGCRTINSWGLEVNRYYHLKKIGELDFWQEISGFFHAREKVYVQEGAEDWAYEYIPTDISIINGLSVCAGDYVVDKDLNVYRIFGWDNDHNSEYYWDYLNGTGSHNLRVRENGIITNYAL
jgi:hypothetical protein